MSPAPSARLLTPEHLPRLARLAEVFRRYGIKLFISISFDSPMVLSGVRTADPLDEDVAAWWRRQVAVVYEHIPDLGGFVVKADSESRPGPHVYGRTPGGRSERPRGRAGAVRRDRGLAGVRVQLLPGLAGPLDRPGARRLRHVHAARRRLCRQRDRADQARPDGLPGQGAGVAAADRARQTSQAIEVQITQEYTGQQKDLCFLHPQWHEVMNGWRPRRTGRASRAATTLAGIVSGHPTGRPLGGVAGVANVGDDPSWTGTCSPRRTSTPSAGWRGIRRSSRGPWPPNGSP